VGGKNGDEVYLAARDVMGSAKLSMHSSGRWRWAMTSQEAARQQLAAHEDRVMLRWEVPAPVAAGWIRAATLSIPSLAIRPLGQEKIPRKGDIAFWTVEPKPCEVWFDIFIKSPGAPELSARNVTELVGSIGLPGGGAIWVVGTEWEAPIATEAKIIELRRQARDIHVRQRGIESYNSLKAPTGAAWGRDDSDGRPVVIDLGDLRAGVDESHLVGERSYP
jgi:hypothetical protein